MKIIYILIAMLIPFSAVAEEAAPVKKETVTLNKNETVEIAGYPLTVTLIRTDNSLCPKGARCMWAGELTAEIKMVYEGSESKGEFCFDGACAMGLEPIVVSVPDTNIKIYAEKYVSPSQIKIYVSE